MVEVVTNIVLFSAKLTNPICKPLTGGKYYKIVGFGLGEWDYITFMLVAGGGNISISKGSCHDNQSIDIAEYGREHVMCEACCGARPRKAILTKYNNTVFIDASTAGTYLIAEYHGDPLNISMNMLENTTVRVVASVTDGFPRNITASQRGCPNLLPYATVPITCGLVGYSPNLPRDPRASVALTGCDNEVIAYIYPTPEEGASAPITGCNNTIIGYAINTINNNGDCQNCK